MSLIFAIETNEKYGSIALLDGKQIISESRLPEDRRSAQTLFPAIHSIFQETGTKPQDVEIVAAVIGPGSFTGLRVGITAAKLFAYSVGAEIRTVNTFETVAAGMLSAEDFGENPPEFLTVGVDAQRGDVAVMDFCFYVKERIYQPLPSRFVLMPFEKWRQRADEQWCFTGPALERYAAKLPPETNIAGKKYWFPQASFAAKLVKRHNHTTVSPFDLLPIYSRLSAAEENKRGIN